MKTANRRNCLKNKTLYKKGRCNNLLCIHIRLQRMFLYTTFAPSTRQNSIKHNHNQNK